MTQGLDWQDEAVVLSTRRHGESAGIVSLLTRHRGRQAGLLHGLRRHGLQPGTRVVAAWRARLADQLGTFGRIDPEGHAAVQVFDRPLQLAALASACALVEAALPEHAPYTGVYEGLLALLDALDGGFWDAAYVQWELGLLQALGFGLDLQRCAATGATEGLAFVSPRSGRAVSEAAAAPWRDRLLPLPGFLVRRGEARPADVLSGLDLTGHFLDRTLFGQGDRAPPPARERFLERYRRYAARPVPVSSDSDPP